MPVVLKSRRAAKRSPGAMEPMHPDTGRVRRDGNLSNHDAVVVVHGDADAADTQFDLLIVQRLTS